MHKKYNDTVNETKENLYELYITQNMTIIELSKKYNVLPKTMITTLRNLNIIKPSKKQLIYPILEKRLNEGYTFEQIAKELKISTSTLRRRMKENNIKRPINIRVKQKPKKILNINKHIFESMFMDMSLTIAQLCKNLNITRTDCEKLQKQYNLPSRKSLRLNYIKTKMKEEKPTKEELEDLYFNKHLTKEELCKFFHTNYNRIKRWCDEYDIRYEFVGESLPKEKLYELYIIKNMSQKEIAKLYNTNFGVINNLCKKYSLGNLKSKNTYSFLTKEFLTEQYINQNKSIIKISKEYKAPTSVISNKIKRYNLAKLTNEQKIKKEELENLYIHKHLSITKIAKQLGSTSFIISNLLTKYNIPKRPLFKNKISDLTEKDKENLVDLYVNKNKSIKNLADKYNLPELTISNFLNSLGIKTHRDKIVFDAEQLKDMYLNKNMTIKEIANKLGVSYHTIQRRKNEFGFFKTSDQITECVQKTQFKLHDGCWSNQDPKVREKTKQTCLKKYGVEHTFQIPEVKEKIKQTNLKRYGVEYVGQSEIIKEKIYNTQKEKDICPTSKEEDLIYNIMLTKFDKVERQYRTKEYPFKCDFYIPELDLYIEYQGYWSHGDKPYKGTPEDLKIIETWQSKGTEKYLAAIKTWTIFDPLKRGYAKTNHLNWIEFFTIEEFKTWFEKQ